MSVLIALLALVLIAGVVLVVSARCAMPISAGRGEQSNRASRVCGAHELEVAREAKYREIATPSSTTAGKALARGLRAVDGALRTKPSRSSTG